MVKPSEALSVLPQKSTIGRLIVRAFAIGLRAVYRLQPALGARAALRVFLTPQRFARPGWEEKILAGARRSTVTTRQHRIATWVWGEPGEPCVLLVHGWAGRGSQLGQWVAPLRAAGFAVATFDAPGHGASSGRTSSLPEMEEALHAVVASLGAIHAAIAHSAGAPVVTAALRERLGVGRLAFIAPGVHPQDFVAAFGQQLDLPADLLAAMARALERRFDIALSDYDTVRNAQLLAPNAPPLLIAQDDHDIDLPPAGAQELAASWPQARLLRTTGLGHRRILRDNSLIQAVVGFVGRPAPRANETLAALG
jgi:pimeloyl-ACP methyl ester carboxylesterase